ncbi:mucin-3A-like [Chamaea fasciata]|uniref:mucin-3A-like n=1 Tax=Chamaea fasciata TaxID=190680 RepID=UPI00336A2305
MESGGGSIFILLLLLLVPSEVLSGPCANGGTAVGDGCVCPPGHSGHLCLTPDPSGSCRNGGTAVGTSCYCPPGFGGPRCQHPDPASACHNGATPFGTRCVCPPGFRGDTCRDAEEPASCLNGGTLEKGTCRCPPAAWGPRCECTAAARREMYVGDTAVTRDTATSVGGDAAGSATDTPPARRERNVTARPVESDVTKATSDGRVVGRNVTVTAVVSADADRGVVAGTDHDVVTTTVANANTDHDYITGTDMVSATVVSANTDHDVVTTMETDTEVSANTDHDFIPGTDHDVVTTTKRSRVVSANTDHDVVTTTVANANTDHDFIPGTDHDVVTTTKRSRVVSANTDHDVVTTTKRSRVVSANTDNDVVTTMEMDTEVSANTDHDFIPGTDHDVVTTTAVNTNTDHDFITVTTTEKDTRVMGSVPTATTAGDNTTTVPPARRARNVTASPVRNPSRATTMEGDTTAVEGDTTAVDGDTTVMEGDTTVTEGDTEVTPVEGDTEATTAGSDTAAVLPGHLGSHSRATTRARTTTAVGNSSRATTVESDTRATTLKSDTRATTPDNHTLSTLPVAPANVTSRPAPPGATNATLGVTETPPNVTEATGALGHGSARTVGDVLTSPATSVVTTVATICLFLPHGSSPPAIVCRNGGVANLTRCLCPPGYSGPTCETPDPDDLCAHGGTAVGHLCVCPPGRAGPRCAAPDPATACRHGGTAVGTRCYCPRGFSGPRCENAATAGSTRATATRSTGRTTTTTTTTAVPTTRDPCLNGGRWTGTACLCPPNMDGPRCEFGATTINLTAELGPFVTMMARVTNREFSEDMADAASPGHRRFAEEFGRTMDGIYRNVSGYRGIDVLSLSRGSVVVSYRVRLLPRPGDAGLERRALELLAVANAAPRPHSCDPSADGLCFTATAARAARAAAPALNDTELCRKFAPANFSRFYFPHRTAGGGLLCVTNCTLNVPGSFDCHRGLCRLTLEGPQCFCPDLPWYLSSGDRCQTHISKLGLGLGVGLGLGLTILILLILCIVLAVRLARGRKKSPGASPLKLARLHSAAAEDVWPDGGRNGRVTGIYHVNGAGKGPYGQNTYKPSSEVAEPPASVLAEGAAAL